MKITLKSFDIWLGLAFERFCLKHNAYIAELMGFGNEILLASPYFEKADVSFQIDLLYVRSDNVITICEIKHHNKEITTKIIPEMEKKCKSLKMPKGYTLDKALISLYGPDKALKESKYFDYSIILDDLF